MGSNKIQKLAQDAQKFISAGQFTEAIDCYRDISKLDKNNPAVWTALGSLYGQLGNYAESTRCFGKVIRMSPSDAQAHLNLAKALHASNKLEDARAAYQRALNIAPGLNEAMFNLGTLYGQAGNFEQAVSCFRQLCERVPELADNFYSLGSALVENRQPDEAIPNFRKAIQLQPNYTDAHNSLGVALQSLQQHEEAETCYKKALEYNPDYATAHYNLGTLLHDTARFGAASRSFARALELKPDYTEACVALGRTHHACANFTAAITCYRQALELDTGNIDALVNLGYTYQGQGKFSEALETFRAALQIDPDSADSLAGEASILERMGEFEQALDIIEPLLQKNVANAGLALAYGTVARRTDQHKDAISYLESMIENTAIPAHRRAEMHLNLGHLLHDLENYDGAFQHFATGNQLLNYTFDKAAHSSYINRLINAFSRDNLQQLPHAGNTIEKPVFIVAMPRSGTSLLEQILASHPAIEGAGELPYIGQISTSLPQRTGSLNERYPECVSRVTTQLLDQLAGEYMKSALTRTGDTPRFTDKMPHNFLDLGLIELLFPKARVIHIMRNPMDTCLSIFTQNFAASHAYAASLDSLGFFYRQYERLMEHWRSVLSIPFMEIHYSDLVTEPEASIRKLVSFCGLEWDDACLEFHQTKRHVATPSYDQVRQPMYRSALERWRKYEKHLDPLRQALES